MYLSPFCVSIKTLRLQVTLCSRHALCWAELHFHMARLETKSVHKCTFYSQARIYACAHRAGLVIDQSPLVQFIWLKVTVWLSLIICWIGNMAHNSCTDGFPITLENTAHTGRLIYWFRHPSIFKFKPIQCANTVCFNHTNNMIISFFLKGRMLYPSV